MWPQPVEFLNTLSWQTILLFDYDLQVINEITKKFRINYSYFFALSTFNQSTNLEFQRMFRKH